MPVKKTVRKDQRPGYYPLTKRKDGLWVKKINDTTGKPLRRSANAGPTTRGACLFVSHDEIKLYFDGECHHHAQLYTFPNDYDSFMGKLTARCQAWLHS